MDFDYLIDQFLNLQFKLTLFFPNIQIMPDIK